MPDPSAPLSRRERQIMDALHRLRRASVAEVRQAIPDAPSYNSIRVTLSILERKGQVRHESEGRRYFYEPTTRPERARNSALRHVVSTFFQDDASQVVSTLFGLKARELSDEDLSQLEGLIEREKERRRE